MIIWGSGGDTLRLGEAGVAHCSTCEKERGFKNVLSYRYAHLWYVFCWVTEKAYYTVCDACGRGPKQDAKTMEAQLGKSPIPAHRRFGGLVLLGLVVLAVIVGVIGSQASDRRENVLLDQPQVGDLYTVDLEDVVPGAFEGRAYGIMRVKAVNGDTITLQPPNTGNSKLSAVGRDVDGAARLDAYYVAETVSFPLAKLKQLHDNGDIVDVTR